ncbi:MAG: polysaccharide deacetylase family protein [Chloroflexi bacterium]|jgi:peptidoglycan/xylan/chitin deacetylase (PgdA/CDA1 family)|nr:polysaccharide deacetylase family protein [Chloroflexota bacterium]MBT3670681.1 polysaccharide deacetylase family protein [Chloroflexota bacterium]MBT4002660.1 polysaccharide deacetylase family protein [Chloroflexota bacterium]MBT4306283.1 polysaccharide deacetylase family protein [Chloroflexota bacterium]MBT4532836.1 polysaccharide deacetylase family protein [Chloroflexota bacterium]
MKVKIILVLSIFIIAGCSGQVNDNLSEVESSPTIEASQTPKPVIPTSTLVPTASSTPSPTDTPTLTPTATWAFHAAGPLVAPILMYHHVSPDNPGRYNVNPENFENQMKRLKELGYTSITTNLLIEAVLNGAELPERPIVITFDDGQLSVFEHAFPIMEKYGFIGNVYIVSNYLEVEDYMGKTELLELVDAGWEVGSHSASHADLTGEGIDLGKELGISKDTLEKTLGIKITTLAYPFGTVNERVVNKAYNYGYYGALGVAEGVEHTRNSIFYLNRIEIFESFDLTDFENILPWNEID